MGSAYSGFLCSTAAVPWTAAASGAGYGRCLRVPSAFHDVT